MDARVVELKKIALQYQVLSEDVERDDSRFLADVKEWLSLETVDPTIREIVTKRLSAICRDLVKARETIKGFLDGGVVEVSRIVGDS